MVELDIILLTLITPVVQSDIVTFHIHCHLQPPSNNDTELLVEKKRRHKILH